jgi:putative endopeptidase
MSADTHGINTSSMDPTCSPGKDFFRYANGKWIDTTKIPDEYSRWGTFLILHDRLLDTLKSLMEKAAANTASIPGSNDQKIGDFFFTGMNESKIEAEGAQPLAGELATIDGIRTKGQLADAVARFQLLGMDVMFGFGSGQDAHDSTQVIAQAVQGGLGLPERDYYTKNGGHSARLREQYVAHVARMFELLGRQRHHAKKAAQAVMAIETALAKAAKTNVALRNPVKNYHKMSVAKFCALIPLFPAQRFLSQLGCAQVAELNVGQPRFFKALNRLFSETSISQWRHYLRWHLIKATAPYLSSAFADESFDFWGHILTGSKVQQPRWKRVVATTDAHLGEALGELYVRDNFPPQAKTRVTELVSNLCSALKNTLNTLDWMSESTRQSAQEKLAAFVAKIGYPDKWLDYSALEINRDSYVGNVLRASKFLCQIDLAKIGKTVDRTEWFMTPQTINAYYSPAKNEIVFPAAILQPPFFDMLADDATNYGGIGMVIGHEMTHGFDDQGSKYDAHGNLREWWTDEDKTQFDDRTQLIREQYSSYQVSGGAHVKGPLVSGEAAADLGGLKIAYLALQRALTGKVREKDANGFTEEQRFFLSCAQVWSLKARPEQEELQVATDPHPPAQFRVNGTLANMPEFAQAFDLPADCEMMLPPEKRCRLW